jgi:hypothetical protein
MKKNLPLDKSFAEIKMLKGKEQLDEYLFTKNFLLPVVREVIQDGRKNRE